MPVPYMTCESKKGGGGDIYRYTDLVRLEFFEYSLFINIELNMCACVWKGEGKGKGGRIRTSSNIGCL